MDTNFTKQVAQQMLDILRAPARYLNNQINRFAVTVPTPDQKSVFKLGDNDDISALYGEAPTWCYGECIVAAQDTMDTRIGCPDDFVVMAILARYTVNTALAGFRLQIYDTNRKMQLIKDRPVNVGTYAGNGTS